MSEVQLDAVFPSIPDGLTNINKGYLINQCEVQIRLHSDPIYMWTPKHRDQTYSIKCTAVDYSQQVKLAGKLKLT